MKKKEWVYREILYQVIEERKNFLTQREISNKCGISIGNTHHALKPLESMNAIEKLPRGFRVINPKKILLYWASVRDLNIDLVYKTFTKSSVIEIERTMPKCLFTAYSGYKFLFNSVPSDYSEVFVYSENGEVRARFPEMNGKQNVFVLKMDSHLAKFRKIPIAQLFVDLWNINTWYAQEFLRDLEAKINGILE